MYPSKMEQLILDRSFSYLQPYFYNHPYALRCELGIAKDQEYIDNAKKRAAEIIVFCQKEKMKQFYHKLKPYFLQYDAEEMEKRFYAG